MAGSGVSQPSGRQGPDAADQARATAIRRGDVRAFETFFLETAPALCVFVSRYVESREDAKDIVQEVFSALWTKRETLLVRESLTAYVYTAARNRAFNFALREQRHAKRSAALAPTNEDTVPDTDDTLFERELARALVRAIDALPTRCRQVFELSRRHGMTHSAIAASLGVSVKTVETQIGRAIKAVRRRVEPYL